MRNALAVSIAAILGATSAPVASSQPGYEPGSTVVSASVGSGIRGLYGTADMPLLALSFERGVSDDFSIGASIGTASSTYRYGFGSDYRWTLGYTIVAARGSYHFTEWFDVDRLDLYGGGSLGFNRVSIKEKVGRGTELAAGSYWLYGVHFGGRYFFRPSLAGFVEVGYGLGNAAAGVSMRF